MGMAIVAGRCGGTGGAHSMKLDTHLKTLGDFYTYMKVLQHDDAG